MLYQPSLALSPLLVRPHTGSVVVAQLGQTLDGRIATVTGASKYISGREALRHLHRLRACVDAVIVGVGTVIADDPLLTVRLVPGQNPVRVVVDPRGRMPETARMLHDGAGPVIVACGPGVTPPPGAEALHLPVLRNPDGTPGGFDPFRLVSALAARGLRRMLVEGGAETLSRFLDAGAIDILHVLVAPMILGSGKACLSMRPIDRLDEALRPATQVHLFEDGDVLFTCELRAKLEAAE
jgi:riboflavin-specific deaminase-like protein